MSKPDEKDYMSITKNTSGCPQGDFYAAIYINGFLDGSEPVAVERGHTSEEARRLVLERLTAFRDRINLFLAEPNGDPWWEKRKREIEAGDTPSQWEADQLQAEEFCRKVSRGEA